MPPSRPTSLTFITSNPNKLSEVQSILSALDLDLDLRSQSLQLVEIQAASVVEVAREKCCRAAEVVCIM